ncbi:2-amino-4-hydroxy-6-hydroxymethyldihydropteridine diphosphokinase [Algoriphagus sediminis]|uniref:2-amino-4-hydroxy-6-hydroxymethyldihydropteridine pyrophosphokinase n=1 Tax=Algoriphagus sediminis TaxID=3057113 RepID=A0ABT7YA14_9BACT|nr:2-amino-4-hydroxy-6-hydroxymethyldihydropteridine diphosphokinase [Algoriphagus sediminis]MDN3203054.1 2-amino-4-hydroxy-6-hydroxymethyldihydropteridine diphosphokinase [Algoriphagus sediminis]
MKSVLLLGSNMGDREQLLSQTRELISKQMDIISLSKVYETEAWGPSAKEKFLNQALLVETSFFPEELLGRLKGIESELGRVRKQRWSDRNIDIDILYFGDRIINLPTLQIPHPHISNRRFALVPLAELLPDFVNPLERKNHQQLLEECSDEKKVWEYTPKP